MNWYPMKKRLILLLPALLMINILFTWGKITNLEAQLGWATGKQKIEILLSAKVVSSSVKDSHVEVEINRHYLVFDK